jgi:hypothetical protein
MSMSRRSQSRNVLTATRVTVLVGGQDGSRLGRLWTYIGDEHPYSVYDFTESRARDGPA